MLAGGALVRGAYVFRNSAACLKIRKWIAGLRLLTSVCERAAVRARARAEKKINR